MNTVSGGSGEWAIHRPSRTYSPSSKLFEVETNNPTAAANSNVGVWNILRSQAVLGADNRVAYAHNKTANVLFFDLHIAAKDYNALYHQYNVGKNWQPYTK